MLKSAIHFLYFATVFTTGAVVLILEVAAVRLLTPIFGSSIYVLSSVLTTILLALSLGYFVGGRLSDHSPHYRFLYYLITTAGLLILILLHGSLTVIYPMEPVYSIIVGPLIYSLFFFFTPAFLLGMDSPYVIKLMTINTTPERSGRYVGGTFFWSTIGSICGSLSSGFWLIPQYGVVNTITGAALSLIAVGLLAPLILDFFHTQSFPPTRAPNATTQIAIIVLTLTVTGGLLTLIKKVNTPPTDVLFETDGLYSRIRITEETTDGRQIRRLRRDTNNSSAIYVDSTEHVFEYTRFVDIYPHMVADPEKFLMIGGGAYTIPRRVVDIDPNITVDVVEIEPQLFSLAQEYFQLDDISRINNYPEDARIFLKRTDSKYDVIFSDVFSSPNHIPFHLATVEYFQALRSALDTDGIVLVNLISSLNTETDSLTTVMIKTMSEVFPQLHAFTFRQEEEIGKIRNIIILASPSDDPLDFANVPELTNKHASSYPITTLAVDLSAFATKDALILTDDRSPIEFLLAKQLNKY